MKTRAKVVVRELGPGDAEGVARIAAKHDAVAPSLVADVALGAEVEGRLVGFLTGDVRIVEFGSERCGWILALGVDPDAARQGSGRALLEEGCRRFRALGVRHLRTMVRRNVVPVLSLFRSCGFVGGPFTQMELALDEEAGPGRAGGTGKANGPGTERDGRNGTANGSGPAHRQDHGQGHGGQAHRGEAHRGEAHGQRWAKGRARRGGRGDGPEHEGPEREGPRPGAGAPKAPEGGP